MRLYAVCPICGHKLLKGEDGTNAEVLCPKCCHKIIVIVENRQVKVTAKESYDI